MRNLELCTFVLQSLRGRTLNQYGLQGPTVDLDAAVRREGKFCLIVHIRPAPDAGGCAGRSRRSDNMLCESLCVGPSAASTEKSTVDRAGVSRRRPLGIRLHGTPVRKTRWRARKASRATAVRRRLSRNDLPSLAHCTTRRPGPTLPAANMTPARAPEQAIRREEDAILLASLSAVPTVAPPNACWAAGARVGASRVLFRSPRPAAGAHACDQLHDLPWLHGGWSSALAHPPPICCLLICCPHGVPERFCPPSCNVSANETS